MLNLTLLISALSTAMVFVLAAYGIAAAPAGHDDGPAWHLRVTEDAVFGPTISVAQEGRVARDLPPLNLPLARALALRVAERPGADVAAVADALVRVSQLVVDFPALAALDLALAAGGAQSASLRLRPAGTPAAPLAIAPYPAELAGTFAGRNTTFVIRPIRPEDAAAHAALFARLPAQDVRFRFFSALRELSPDQVARLMQVDYDREIAFIAVRPAGGETVGVARLVADGADGTAEFAIVVQPDVKGQGLATHLMQRLIAWGHTRGLPAIVGQVLADNAAMLAFVRRLGFTLARAPDDETVVEARLDLADGT